MEQLLEKLRAYSRFLELEDSIPYWEAQIPELENRITEMTWNLQQKEQSLLQLKQPGFFQRILGRAEEQQNKINKQIQEINAAKTAAQWDLDGLKKRVEAGKEERERLTGSGAVYEEAKINMVFTPAQESRLMMAELSAFAPAAMATAGRVLEALDAARLWMGQESINVQVQQEVEAAANRLRDILSVLPEGVAPVGSFLRVPGKFLTSSGLDQAQEQIQQVINQLRLLLGE